MTDERKPAAASPAGNRQVSVLGTAPGLSALEKCLLNEYQRGFPLCPEPYAEIAAQLGVAEADVIQTLESLQRRGFISRVGPVFAPQRAGASTLAALAVPEDRLEEVAGLVSAYAEVNHNYQRDHAWNLWFVVTAPDTQRVQQVLADIESATGLGVLNLPLERAFYIDLGFPLWC
jgi:DNA-binding Lrp family transcriptional regulator